MVVKNNNVDKGVSIIICTFNGMEKLFQTLKHISEQEIPSTIKTELIVVDNASWDGSLQFVEEKWREFENKHKIPLYTFQEPKPGKYFALQTAIEQVSYSYFIICDDDNWLDKDYVRHVFSIFESSEQIGAIGGQSIPFFGEGIKTPPYWLEKYNQYYALGKQGEKSGDVTNRLQFWGAGLASRTNLYREMYHVHPSFLLHDEDNNQSILFAEDTEYCLRLILSGYRLYYSESLLLQHYVPKERLSEQYRDKLINQAQSSQKIIRIYTMATRFYGVLAKAKNTQLLEQLKINIKLCFSFSKSKQHKYKTAKLFLSSPKQKGITNILYQIKKIIDNFE